MNRRTPATAKCERFLLKLDIRVKTERSVCRENFVVSFTIERRARRKSSRLRKLTRQRSADVFSNCLACAWKAASGVSNQAAETCCFRSTDFTALSATGVSPVQCGGHWRHASGTRFMTRSTRIVNCDLPMDYRFWSVTRSPAFGVLSIRRTVGSVLLE